ncbi:cold shock and DUF1294 domain-containing protein [Luteimonas vadosa]|uniref:Cold shock and DUF1294 domain-containing protein n=1 Tax=Luteimonas vadosa TaxID=1165507 RepID=A0ABP9DYT9_9GAMM
MRYVGRLQQWNDDKGYGFVVPHEGGARAFVHVRSFEVPGRRPADGDLVSYEARADAKGRLAATRVRFAGQRVPTRARGPDRARRRAARLPRAGIGLAMLATTTSAMLLGVLPTALGLAWLGMSAVSFFAYGLDKAAAGRRGVSRIPEATLHLMDLLGGWPGALVAQQLARHKTVKASFQAVFWLTVAANLGLAAWAWHGGMAEAISRGLAG